MPREKKEIVMPSKKSNIFYENWKVYSRQHKLMFRCNEKKAQWYLKRNLANIIDSEPKAIALNFETKGNGHKEGDYMVQDRSNVCVGCGQNEHLTVHHVVPEMYRHWMPLVIKSKSSRDLLLLCKQCHTKYEADATLLKKQYAKQFDIPLEGKGWVNLPEHRKARKAASALIHAADKIPQERQAVLETIVRDFWKKHHDESVNRETMLKRCSELEDFYKGPDFIEHGQGVIGQLMERHIVEGELSFWPDLENFIKEWRQHFIDHLKPTHLSELWTVDGDIYTR
ncbi:uncharacterized protein RHIMIDRAFT_275013 [Rhizopus microsporus ATCC 52813]|uniref:HNH domain-containing protein n=2 Tax=Rhizopus microsporus TaxID=58291 RepID=A0A2G4SEU6_RHIZD|nr:uncharacterized protein RHIMIDRAFT_275013 [Rhizopus microsporus ATCC 52813]PHZ07307.1 hypothetical protein RHIMIDRAFT_275013 [Rhizopus microsporus ATCC 52813]